MLSAKLSLIRSPSPCGPVRRRRGGDSVRSIQTRSRARLLCSRPGPRSARCWLPRHQPQRAARRHIQPDTIPPRIAATEPLIRITAAISRPEITRTWSQGRCINMGPIARQQGCHPALARGTPHPLIERLAKLEVERNANVVWHHRPWLSWRNRVMSPNP